MNCIVCGKEIERSQYSKHVLCSSQCFHIQFWKDIIAEKDEHIVIDGECYYVSPESSCSIFRGYCGKSFTIRKFTGEIIHTTNLWCNGTVPDEFKDQLPNEAEFIGEVPCTHRKG